MFQIGDIIRHKKENKYYIVLKKSIYSLPTSEIISFEAQRLDDEYEKIIMHYPLMTCYFEVIKTALDIEK